MRTVLLFLTILVFPLVTAEASFTISIEEPDQHFFSGDSVERTVIIKGNSLRDTEAVVGWETLVPPAIIERGKKKTSLKSSSENRFKICLKMPVVKRRAELIWKIRVTIKGNETLKREIHYSVFPVDIPSNVKNILSKKRIGVLDSKGDVGKILKNLGVSFVQLRNQLSLETFDGDLIIIGPHTFSSWYLKNALLLLEEKVNEGLIVLCFGQESPHPFLSRMEEIVSKPTPLSSSRIAAPGHPVFQEVMEGDLSSWRGNGIIAYFPYQLPRGNFRALVRTDLSDRAVSLLVEVPYGRGKFLFCQLLVIKKFKEEPVARLLFENLIRYALMSQKPLQPAVIYGEPESEMMKLLNSVGVVGSRNPDRLGDSNLVIICADKELAQLRDRIFQQRLKSFVRQGGVLIIFGFARENADFFSEMLPGIEWTNCIHSPVTINRENPILWGITENDIKQALDIKHFFSFKKSFEERYKINTIIKSGIMAKIQQGKGKIVICQLQFKEDSERSVYILSQLLTNLGVKIEEAGR